MSTTVQIEKQILPFTNLSLFLNDIKPIQNLTITNNSEINSGPLSIKIECDLPCFERYEFRVTTIPPGKKFIIPLNGLTIKRDFIESITEIEKANISIEIQEENQTILKEKTSINIHPSEYFGGFETLPELIAAFITPNHHYIYSLKRKAIEILQVQGLKTAFEGYQSNSHERVLQIMSALYSAIRSEEIIYSASPPGYLEIGQRIRLLDTIQQEKFGNCIEMSLLFAACLEAVNLNPILIVTEGHAFIACWLHDEKFAEVTNDDKTAITKRLSKGISEIAAIEATCLCKDNGVNFIDALQLGESHLIEKDDFLLSIDIKRARAHGIRPLPSQKTITGEPQESEVQQEDQSTQMDKEFKIGTIYHENELNKKQPKTKLKIWERNLLDLSLKNSLLNLKTSRNMLQLVDIDISHLEDNLADGKSFQILPDPKATVLKKYNIFNPPIHHSSDLFKLANDDLKHQRLRTYYHTQDLDSILVYLNKNARLAVEENGSSTLYLAVGLLKWLDKKNPEIPKYAPILLLPVELNRKSVNSKFTLKSREEETMVNITLIEFLRQEYELNLSALEQLPTDEKGVDVPKVMGFLRRSIMQLKGWDVEERIVLGNFSFSKLILWKDIVVSQEEILKSNLVRSLVEGKRLDEDEYHHERNLDGISANNVMLPIATDASQLEAVLAAQKGQSFILHGPPGTGKSQTITNIIADSLYRGKRVLFVAAKKAALDVVHKRLEQIGLAPFTLELHSNKSKKSDVLNQLAKSLETVKVNSKGNFQQEANRLDTAKSKIQEYVSALHDPQEVGWSLYESITAIDNYIKYKFPKIVVPEAVFEKLNPDLWGIWLDWLDQAYAILRLIAHPAENPLNALNLPNYSNSIDDEINQQTKELLKSLQGLEDKSHKVKESLLFPFSIEDKHEWDQFKKTVEHIVNFPVIPLEIVEYLANRHNYEYFKEWATTFEKLQHILGLISKEYNREILNAEILSHESEWTEAKQKWILSKWLKTKKIKKKINQFKKDKIQDNKEIDDVFHLLKQFKEINEKLQQKHFLEVETSLKTITNGEATDISSLRNIGTFIREFSDLVTFWESDAVKKWIEILTHNKVQDFNQLIKRNELDVTNYIKRIVKTLNLISNYTSLTGIIFQQRKNWNKETLLQVEKIDKNLPGLKNWVNYERIKKQGIELKLNWCINAFEDKVCTNETLKEFFQYTVHTTNIHRILSRNEAVNLFNVEVFETQINTYKKLANEFREATIHELRSKLAAQIPNTTKDSISSSEIGILQRAIKSKGRGLSVRKLFDQIPTLLPRLSPCMLMSPISVAQYFDLSSEHFDILIFDEASQLPTCEAVSALARAKQSIIVGDPNQMPPTSFFSTNKLDEENMDVEDLESILDECLALSIPSKHLSRHYRSKHESLIAFSNINFYDNKLVTFPSADDLNTKVIYHPIKGFYDKGKTKTNQFEADAIVNFVKAHYGNPQHKKLSLGIVTFNKTQQILIEEKIQSLFMSNHDLEKNASESDEPLFIKNLENVQGDERDIILFSICYGPNEEGKMSMNFGPINKEGGWRRLNVAVTRARYEMHIFSTLTSDLIDLNRTSTKSVGDLKAFLKFAENGQLSIRPEDFETETHLQHLSATVSRQLETKGLKVKCNVGTSGFKVDIGVIHPNKPQQYILGILIDGHYYNNAQTTNDREMVMPTVLGALGWNIFRIWTMDWLENSSVIIEAILDNVNNLLSQPIPEEKIFENPIREEISEPIQTENDTNSQPNKISKQIPYSSAILKVPDNASLEAFFNFQNRKTINLQIQTLLDFESPISKNLLTKKVLQAWNLKRTGSRLEKFLDEIIDEMNLVVTNHHQPFYWKSTAELDFYRDNKIEKRIIDDIAPEEILVLVEEVLNDHLSIEENELLRHLAGVFGFAKLGKQIETLLSYTITIAEKQGKIKKTGTRVKIPDTNN